MASLPKGFVLKDWQRADPLVWSAPCPAPPDGYLSRARVEQMLDAQFGPARSGASRLQTWGRDESDPDGPHLIGVRNGTPMHTDAAYPRYTHQVVVYNDGWALTGWGGTVRPIPVGVAFCCDTHSPHRVVRHPSTGDGASYLAVSMDAPEPLPPAECVRRLLAFLHTIL